MNDKRKQESKKPVIKKDTSSGWVLKNTRFVMFIAVMLFFLAITLLFIDQLLRPDAFHIRKVNIIAKYEKVDAVTVKEKLGDYIGQNYFSVELNELRDNLLQIPWVSAVTARREWPAKLFVKIDEHVAQAKWHDDQLIDSNKILFDKPTTKVPNNLVQLAGPKGSHEAVSDDFIAWKTMLARRGYIIESIELSERYTYDLTLRLSDALRNSLIKDYITEIKKANPDDDFEMKLDTLASNVVLKVGSNQLANERIERFMNIIDIVINQDLLFVESIDLRYEHGFSVKWINDQQPKHLVAKN